jgi:hypothetical protein
MRRSKLAFLDARIIDVARLAFTCAQRRSRCLYSCELLHTKGALASAFRGRWFFTIGRGMP